MARSVKGGLSMQQVFDPSPLLNGIAYLVVGKGVEGMGVWADSFLILKADGEGMGRVASAPSAAGAAASVAGAWGIICGLTQASVSMPGTAEPGIIHE